MREVITEKQAAAVLRAAREAVGMTQKALAARMHVNRQAVARHEKAETAPKVGTWLRSLQALGRSVVVVPAGALKMRSTEDFRDSLMRARLGAGLRQLDLAERTGMGRALVGKYETGHYEPGLRAALDLLDAAGLEVWVVPKDEP